ncbi:MAG TPA: hypothetical protein VM345_10290 [Acidimicrobiales bacterium]|nr:hypothetical protein [Acidimicrobiales bacterium]
MGERLARRHRDYFLDLLRRAEPELHGPEQVRWLDLLAANHDNVRAAIDWSLASNEVDDALVMVAKLRRFWEIRGHWAEGRRQARRVVDAATDAAPPALVAAALLTAVRLAQIADHQSAGDMLRSAADAVARADRPELHADLLIMQWSNSLEPRALTELETALELAREADDAALVARAIWELGGVMRLQGVRGGGSRRREALRTWERIGDRSGTAWALTDMAWFKGGAERRAAALRALTLGVELGDDAIITTVADQVTWEAVGRADRAAALDASERGIAAARRTGDAGHQAWLLMNGAYLRAEIGDYDGARQLMDEHRDVVADDIAGRAAGLRTVAVIEEDAGNRALASERIDAAVSLARASGHDRSLAFCLEGAGLILFARGEAASARAALDAAVTALGRPHRGETFNDLRRMTMLLTAISFETGDAAGARHWVARHDEVTAGDLMQAGMHQRLLAMADAAAGELTDAEGRLRRAVHLDLESGWVRWAALTLPDLARVRADVGDFVAAARVLACSDATSRAAGFVVPHFIWRRWHDHLLERLRAALGDSFDTQWQAGRGIPIGEILEVV